MTVAELHAKLGILVCPDAEVYIQDCDTAKFLPLRIGFSAEIAPAQQKRGLAAISMYTTECATKLSQWRETAWLSSPIFSSHHLQRQKQFAPTHSTPNDGRVFSSGT